MKPREANSKSLRSSAATSWRTYSVWDMGFLCRFSEGLARPFIRIQLVEAKLASHSQGPKRPGWGGNHEDLCALAFWYRGSFQPARRIQPRSSALLDSSTGSSPRSDRRHESGVR